jgi:hypothetical protein
MNYDYMQKEPLMNLQRDAIRNLAAALIITFSFATGFQSCSTAGNGGTGAAGEVKGNIHDINQRAQSVFKDMNIQMVSADTKDSGHQQMLGGTSGTENVTIDLTSTGADTTHVEVTAKKGTLSWDKDYAQSVLSKIVQG